MPLKERDLFPARQLAKAAFERGQPTSFALAAMIPPFLTAKPIFGENSFRRKPTADFQDTWLLKPKMADISVPHITFD